MREAASSNWREAAPLEPVFCTASLSKAGIFATGQIDGRKEQKEGGATPRWLPLCFSSEQDIKVSGGQKPIRIDARLQGRNEVYPGLVHAA